MRNKILALPFIINLTFACIVGLIAGYSWIFTGEAYWVIFGNVDYVSCGNVKCQPYHGYLMQLLMTSILFFLAIPLLSEPKKK
jgi:hypothetical protein